MNLLDTDYTYTFPALNPPNPFGQSHTSLVK